MKTRHRILAAAFALFTLGVAAPCNAALPEARALELDTLGKKIARQHCPRGGKASRRAVQNIHYPRITDEIVTYTCKGLEVTLYKAYANNPPNDIAMRAIVTGPHAAMPGYYAVGAPVSALRARLGAPFKEERGMLIYATEDGYKEQTVTFKIAGDRIQSITWDWEVY